MTFIYCLIDPMTNEPRYVGKADDLKVRLIAHLCPSSLKKRNHKNSWLKALKGDGLKPHPHTLQRIPDGYHETWEEAERKWIMLFRLMGYPLTNLCDGGLGGVGAVRSEEVCRRMSRALMGHEVSESTRLKISGTLTGKPRSEDAERNHKRAMKARRGIPHSEQTRRSQGEGQKRSYTRNPGRKNHMLDDRNPMKDPVVAAVIGDIQRVKWSGDGNPMRNPKTVEKRRQTIEARTRARKLIEQGVWFDVYGL